MARGFVATILAFWEISFALALFSEEFPSEQPSFEQLTTEEVVRRSIDALGGQANWDEVHSLRYSGSFSTFSAPRPFVVYLRRPDLYRFEYFYESDPLTVVHDGELAWWINEAVFSLVPWPEPAPPAHARAIRADSELGGPLLDHKEKGHQVEFVGTVDLDGEETYQLVVTLAQGGTEYWHLDPESFLPIARISRGADSRREVEMRSFFNDYREVAGVRIAHHVDIELGFRYQSLLIDHIEANPEIDERLFSMPIPPGMELLKSLAGKWEVEAESRPFARMRFATEKLTASIRPFFRGALLEEEFSYTVFGNRYQVRQAFSYDRFRNVFRVSRFDTLTSHIDVLEGSFENGRLVLSDLESGTARVVDGDSHHARMSVFDISSDAFSVEWALSADGGLSWATYHRFRYTRSGLDDD